ncbi:MAG TPA: ABC transporter substrate-binding protein [Solirubrobacteraceae bacterium]|nr:ABC transporter substrate-binding protein [Solirubrobacteraceae bacterium]
MKTGILLRLGSSLVVGAILAACGNSSSTAISSTVTSTTAFKPALDGSGENLYNGIRGGTLTVEDSTDFQHLDPGQAYDTVSYEVVYATQRPLFSYPPDQTEAPSPDLASGPAIVSADGKTVTVHIKHGVYFSPPVNREVTSSDVAYAIERGANPNVLNPYFSAYFFDIVGASKATGGPIPGIVTPNRYTIVFHLTGPYGTFFASALALPLTAPVPKEFAAPLDAKKPTAYGSMYEVATGPYMLKANAKGMFLGIGYRPGRSAVLVRNPNWNPATDRRPAYLNQIDIEIGGDPNVIGRQVLSGSDMVQNDQVAPAIVQLAYRHYYNQLVVVPGAGIAYVTLNNHAGPFSNVNARRAVWAALNRDAMVNAYGGPVVGQVATHFIYPGSEGYEQAGGAAGPQVDFNRYPSGNMALAAKYMKAAGYPSGRYTGHATVQVVGAVGSPFAELAEIVNQTLRNLGFNTRLTLLTFPVMSTRFCGVPREEIDVCPTAAWTRDFADPQTILDPTFAGYNIVPEGNSNWGQVDDPQINAAMRAAERVVGTAARAQAWAGIDRMLVGIAAAVPYLFNKWPLIESRDVRGINDVWNGGSWDYAYTSLR